MSNDVTINTLLVTPAVFSEVSCVQGRIHGVITSCDTCHDDYTPCLRQSLIPDLIKNQGFVESRVGYNLTPRYHEEKIVWNGQSRIELAWKGISELDVIENLVALATGYAVSPFLQENLTPVDSGNDFCYVTLNKDLFPNPNKVNFFDDEGEVYELQQRTGYPRRDIDGNWRVALGKPGTPACASLSLNAADCRYIMVQTPIFTCNGNIIATYPGTTEIIPYAKPIEIIDGVMRHWFDVWSLVDKAFKDELVNLGNGEFYKLISTIDFYCQSSITERSLLTGDDLCACVTGFTTENLNLRIISAEDGVVEIVKADECWNCFQRCNCSHTKPVYLTVRYKTDPEVLNLSNSLDLIKEAIIYLTAAELPVEACACVISDSGFIARARLPYTDVRINPITGNEVYILKYGNTYGHMVYNERMTRVKMYTKYILV